jgi:hypothetical protein
MKTLSNVKRRLRRTFGYRHVLRSEFRSQETALIVHGLHKSASMFLYKFFDHVCREIEVPLHSINHAHPNHEAVNETTTASFVYCPERSFDTHRFQFPHLKQIHLFQLRDPRDILVSEYFSLGWRHRDDAWNEEEKRRRERIQRLTIDQYVMGEAESSKLPLLTRYLPLLAEMDKPTTHVVKYETMVGDFPEWLRTVLPLMGLVKEDDIDHLARHYRHEFQPDASDNGHKRNVSAGDHRNKLEPKTIDVLNERFDPILSALGYRC